MMWSVSFSPDRTTLASAGKDLSVEGESGREGEGEKLATKIKKGVSNPDLVLLVRPGL
jgi:hypothetical protein